MPLPTPQQKQTIASNANAILDQAAALDTLIGQFRTIAADIAAREIEIRKTIVEFNPNAVVARDGQERLSYYGHAQMVSPGLGTSVADVAANAWAEWL
ncbi:MAG: hypothetical protein J0I13_05430 [Rhizobiales bacterium]|nr:hypothetical protein [Hyphomicrobiales bacterium]